MTVTDLSDRTLPGTDLTVGRMVLGTMTFGTQLDESGSEQAIHRARELGVTMFDTANAYGTVGPKRSSDVWSSPSAMRSRS